MQGLNRMTLVGAPLQQRHNTRENLINKSSDVLNVEKAA
jgi:hypothetical protein